MSESTYPIITRAERKRLRDDAHTHGKKYYFTGVPCKRGHVCERTVNAGQCTECNREDGRQRYKDDPERWLNKGKESYERNREARSTGARKWYLTNKDRMDEYYAEWREEHKDEAATRTRQWYRENKEYYSHSRAEYNKWYAANNQHRSRLYANRRRAQKLSATPRWMTDELQQVIETIYAECVRVQTETGIPHHVDHIIPLQGELVCGLHVPDNLQILTAVDNGSKGNTFVVA